MRASRALTATLLVALAAAPAGAATPSPAPAATTSADAWRGVLATLDRGREPAAVATAIWSALELEPIVGGGPEALAGRLATLARSPLPLVPGEATRALSRVTARTDPTRARALAREAGHLGEGRFIGPLPGPGDAAATPPDAADPAWRPTGDLVRAGPMPLVDLLPSVGDAHLYIDVPLEASAAERVLLVAGSNGPLGLWLDGREVVSWDGERPTSDWQHVVPLDLSAGPHRLVARVGHRSAAPELTLRVVDARGLLPVALGGRATSALGGRRPPLPEGGFAALAKTPLERARLAVWVTPEAAVDRAAADALAGAGLFVLAGRVERSDESRARAAFERAASSEALAALVVLATRQGLGADADRFARALAELEPRHPTALTHEALRRVELADAASALPLVAGDARLAYNARLASTYALLLERAGRIPEAAAAWTQVAALLDGDPEAVQRAVNLWRRADRDDQAIATADAGITRRPMALDLHILRARTLAATRPDAAVEALARIAPTHDRTAAYHETRGRLLLLAGDRGGAVEAFDRALELQPQNRDLADYRRSLVSERGLAERWARPIEDVLAASRGTPPAPEGVVALFERQVMKVFPSGLSSTFRQLVFRLDSEAAAQRMQTFDLDYTPGEDRLEILEAEIVRGDERLRPEAVQDLRQDGKSAGVYTLQAAKVIRFPTLRAGDVMHLQVRSDEIGSRNLFGDFFGAIVPVAAGFPKRESELVIEAPATRKLYWRTQGVPEPKVETTSEGLALQRLTFSSGAVPAIAAEPMMPGYGDIGRWVSVSTLSRWEDLGRWYRELVRAQLEVPPALAAIARDLVAPHTSLRDRVAAIHGWVIANTRYVGIEFGIHGYKPYAVAEVVKRGYGDCKDKAALIVAMAHAVGLDVDFVLVRTRDLGALADTPATLRAFNHAIAYVPGLDLYLDGTAEVAGLDELPELDQDAQVLRMDLYDDSPPVLARVPLQPAALNATTSTSTYVIDAGGDADATFDEVIGGSQAAELRVRLQDPTRRDQLIAGIIAAQHPGGTLVDIAYDNLDRPGQPVGIEATVRLPALGRVSGERMEVPIVLEPGLDLRTQASLAARRHPLVLPLLERESTVDRFTIAPGAGWSFGALPAPVTIDTSFGSYRLEVQRDGDAVVVRQEQVQKVHRIAPADYPAYRRFLAEVARAESTRLELTRSPSHAAER